MSLKIDLYCNDGSPLGVIPPDIYGRGVGGAELSMMSWAETMARRGHAVRIYNNPLALGMHDGVEYCSQASFMPNEDRDVFIVYRSPNSHIMATKAGIKIHWSMDQYTVGNYASDVFPHVDRIVCISPFHVAYHKEKYNADGDKIGYIDLGVRVGDYEADKNHPLKKVPGRCIYCSVPDRGLGLLYAIWSKVVELRPTASLVITGDFTLWGSHHPGNHQYRLKFLYSPNVAFLGKVARERLVQEQMAAQVHIYPCTYNELFCISAAECQVAGAIPVTSAMGALPTTNEWGAVLNGNPMDGNWHQEFIEEVLSAMYRSDSRQMEVKAGARARFDWDYICEQWEHLIETGEFPS